MGLEIRMSGNVTLYRGKGCLQCRGTGYFGRTSVYEVLPYSKQLRKLTTLETDLMAITHQAKVEKLVSLRDNAIKKMLDGVTSLEDVLRVTWEHEEE
jgi:general secretion pathway protein E